MPDGVAAYYRAFLTELDPADPDAARRRLAALDVRALAEWCLEAVRRRDASLVRAVLADSYTHANGFAKISFPALAATPVRLRLHIWPGSRLAARNDPGGTDAHDHKWPFASRILAGALRNDLLRPVPAPRGGYTCLRHEQDGTGYRLTPSGRAGLEPAGTAWSATGETYAMRPATVHRVWVDPGGYAATVVAELAPVTSVTSVFVPAGQRTGPAGTRTVTPARYTAAQLHGWLTGLTEFLEPAR